MVKLSKQEDDRPTALYHMVKRHVRATIERGDWKPNDRLPSEVELVTQLGVSRMTVHRALRELTSSGILFRIPGVGTFVSDEVPASIPLELRDISMEIADRGGQHSAEIVTIEAILADGEVARALEVKQGTEIFHSIIVHRENEQQVQLEIRYVLPVYAPQYLRQDFTRSTTFQYLWRNSKPTAMEHFINAIGATDNISQLLAVAKNEPCILLVRRTWVGDNVATYSRFYYPGSRYRLRDYNKMS